MESEESKAVLKINNSNDVIAKKIHCNGEIKVANIESSTGILIEDVYIGQQKKEKWYNNQWIVNIGTSILATFLNWIKSILK